MRAPHPLLVFGLLAVTVGWLASTTIRSPTISPQIPATPGAPPAAKASADAPPPPPGLPYEVGKALADGPPPTAVPDKVPAKADAVRRWARLRSATPAILTALKAGDTVNLPLLDGNQVAGLVRIAKTSSSGVLQIGGSLDDGGTFALALSASGELSGVIMPKDSPLAYLITTVRGDVYLLEKDAESVICLGLPAVDPTRAAAAATTGATASAAEAAVPVLSSRSDASTVIYLDFDGETVTDPLWNSGSTITAAASGLTTAQMTEVWQRVAEDYRAFDIDVTTDLARYNAVAATYRMRCIITAGDWYYDAYGSRAGGIAYVGSWKYAGTGSYSDDIPCWVFAGNLAGTARYIAEAAAHEVGHTLGLSHDGLRNAAGTTTSSYYTGRGSGATSWAPIMGVGYYVNLVQFSKGEYSDGSYYANNTEDDLAIIVATAGGGPNRQTNHVAYLDDDAGATSSTAAALTYTSTTTIDTVGLIETSGDADLYFFTAAAGLHAFTLAAEEASLTGLQDADVSAVLYDASSNIVASADPDSSLYPSLSATLAAGTYYLKITGVGEGSATSGYYASGYSSYGSIGRYEITGTVVLAPVITGDTAASATVGAAFAYAITADNSPVSYAADSLPDGLAIDTATGLISGTPTTAGVHTVTLSATNAGGTGAGTLTLSVLSALDAWLADESLTDASADTDGDGIINLLEYAFGLDPSSPDVDGLPATSVITVDDTTYLAITFTIPAGLDDLTYTVQLSTDLETWTDGHAYGGSADNAADDLSTAEVSDTTDDDGNRTVQVRSATPLPEQGRAFLRLQVTTP